MVALVEAKLNIPSSDSKNVNFIVNNHTYNDVDILERWNTQEKDGGLLPDGDECVIKLLTVEKSSQVITDNFVVDKKSEKILRRVAPERLVILTKLHENPSIVIKAYRIHLSELNARDNLERERDMLWKCNPEDKKTGVKERGIIRFKYKDYVYWGLEFKREQKISLSDVIKDLSQRVKDKTVNSQEAVGIFLKLYKKVLFSYRHLTMKTPWGEEHVYPTDISPGNVLLSPNCIDNPETAEVKPIDYPDYVCSGAGYGNYSWRTYHSADEALFTKDAASVDESFHENLYAKTAQIMFYAFQKILHKGIHEIGGRRFSLNRYCKTFQPDLVIDKSRSWSSVDAMFGFYDALMDEMLVANDSTKKVKNSDSLNDNLVVRFVLKKLNILHENLDYILVCAEKNDPSYTALRQYRDRSKLMPKTVTGFQEALTEACSAVAEINRMKGRGLFQHRNHVDRRSGGKLALSKNKGAIAGIVLGMIFGGIIPALIALIVLSVLENQKTTRVQQLEVVLRFFKKIEGSLEVRPERKSSFWTQSSGERDSTPKGHTSFNCYKSFTQD